MTFVEAIASMILSDDKNIISLKAAYNAAFSFYGIKFLSLGDDKNFIPFPILTRTLSLSRQIAASGIRRMTVIVPTCLLIALTGTRIDRQLY
ncbi:hypothetical protein O9H85_23795 [Paenibacillus filicis]|uniref:Uncharacterized protein n=1 Tax=Paenibacillus gyeongsangnamensis TaxID=3388067 RepID=A0ABT4QES7_9BACL|nr:hypothetical protein [Paenibacillus filicis]MCZ8515378.1 hypothetical protein [Paenibacillus filicis]